MGTVELLAMLGESPVVLIHGPRQCGKTTLAKQVAATHGYRYFTLDDAAVETAIFADAVGFVADLPEHAIIDEVQRAPKLLLAIKAVVDRDRRPGRLLLTGSSNLLLLPTLADSLAGRMAILRLHPLAQSEIERTKPSFLDDLFSASFPMQPATRLGAALAQRIAAGGYPEAIKRSATRRRRWYRDYVQSLMQRDVQEFARISALDVMPKLLAAAAAQTAKLVNISDLAAPFSLSRTTIRDYVGVLERVFLIEQLSPWHSNRLSRLIKTPKLHLGDTGLACALLGLDAASLWSDRSIFGALLETFVYQELKRHADARDDDIRFSHFRDKDGNEIDLILERGHRLAAVEVKASSTISPTDFRTLHRFREVVGERFAGAALLYDGEISVSVGHGVFAVPFSRLWQNASTTSSRHGPLI